MGLKLFNSSTWNTVSSLKIYTGSSWANAVKGWVYNGSSWSAFYPEFPVLVAAPTTSPQAYFAGAGSTVTCTSGTWSGSPTSYSYAWESRKWDGSGSWASTGVTGNSMFVSSSYVAYNLRCKVTATNARGSTHTYVETGTWGPAALTGLTKTSTGQNTWTLNWNASYGAAQYYIQYQYVGSIPLTEVVTTGTSYNINATQYPNVPAFMGVLVNPLGPSSNGFPSATYNYGYPGYGANA
jgi:hypothetical protein